ncbi:MAG: extracellular solute-binding protein [Chloroflexi bacterium]|nr:extracellular solute-binding protein [Chloroflexota bacterium]
MSDKKLSRRDFLKAASTALAASGFAALPVGLVRAQDDEITISLWGFANNRDEWMQNLVEELWTDMHPNVNVDLSLTPYADLWPKLQAAFVAGAGIPDMVDIEISAMGQFVRDAGSEPYAPLNDHIGEQLEDLSIPSATKPWTVRGNIYGVGNEVNPVLLYYRHDIFDELGMDAEAPATWDEFVNMLGGGAMDAGHGLFPLATQSWADFYVQFHQAGGEFFDAEDNVQVQSQLAIDILNWQKAQLDSGVYIEQGTGDAQYALMNEAAYITVWGAPWYQGFMKQNAPDLAGLWKMRPLPMWGDGGFATVPRGGTGMGITAASENKEAAWEFIRVCNLTAEGSLLAFRRMNLFPSYKPVWDAEELLRTDDYFSGQKPGEFIAEAASAMAEVNVSPYWTLFVDAVNRLIVQPVMLDGADPEAAIQEAIDEFEFNK